tara:strand:+ start:8553 stop:9257 length:705 start_codon:yes stop_codon:yes gene_type:complete
MKMKINTVFFLITIVVVSCNKNIEVLDENKKIKNSMLNKSFELFFFEYQKNMGGKIDSIEEMVSSYEKILYGNVYLENHLKDKVFVSMEEIREYYINNKFEFVRKNDELLVLHFTTENVGEAKKVGLDLSKKDGDVKLKTMKDYNIIYSKLKKGDLPTTLDNIVFSSFSTDRVIGPIKTDFGYHVVVVVDYLKKGGYLGLDEVYDQISQNIYNYKRVGLLKTLIDSLSMEYKND